jgi:hypothetical protein
MNTAKKKDMVVAIHLSKLLAHEDIAKHVIKVVHPHTVTVEYNSRTVMGTERWDLTWPGETYEARKVALQSAVGALTRHGYRIEPRP